LFADTYWAAFAFAQTGSMRGPFSFAASLVIFSVMFVAIIKQVFSLIHVIPDHIMRWLGQSSNMLGGEYGKDLANASSGGAMAIGALGGGMVGKGVSAMHDARKRGAQNEANEMQKQANDRKLNSDALSGMKADSDQQASLQTAEGGGLSQDEAAAVMKGQNAASEKQSDAMDSARSALSSGAMGRENAEKFNTATKQGDQKETQRMLGEAVKTQNQGKDVGQLGAEAADKAYKAHFAGSDSAQGSASANDSPDSFAMEKAQKNMAAAKSAQTSGTGGDTSAPSGQSEGR
jgi:hypothetical protein